MLKISENLFLDACYSPSHRIHYLILLVLKGRADSRREQTTFRLAAQLWLWGSQMGT